MYFTDRLSAPSSSFIPPPVAETGDSGYLPDRESPHMPHGHTEDTEADNQSTRHGFWSTIQRSQEGTVYGA